MTAPISPQTTVQPLSRHPAFPIAVALWFAALLGMGCYVLPAGLFESAVAATGLDAVFPAARPPLGDTARIAISLVAALIGALFGLFVASRVRAATAKRDGETDAETGTVLGEEASFAGDAEPHADADGEPTAWQVWRERMTGDDADPEAEQQDAIGSEPVFVDPSYDEPEAAVPAGEGRDHAVHEDAFQEDTFHEDTGDDLSRLAAARPPEVMDVGPVGGGYDYDFDGEENGVDPDLEADEDPLYDPEADDRQRFEADRLVAGLPRLDRHEKREELPDHPLAADMADRLDPEAEPEPEPEPMSFAMPDEVEDTDAAFEPDGPSFDEEHPETEARAPEPEGAREPRPQDDVPALESLDTPALIARFERALAAHRDRRAAPRDDAGRGADPVVTFLHRDQGNDAPSASEDPQAALRSALEKLDRANRKT